MEEFKMLSNRDLPAEWVVVAGASGAIGTRIVNRLVTRGLGVVAVGRRESALLDLADGRPEVVVCPADIGTDEATERIAAAIPGTVRMLVNAAAAPLGGAVLDVDTAAILGAIEVKVNGTIRLVRAVEERLVVDSRIVVLSGNLGYDPIPEATTAGVGNAALANLMRQLGQALGPRGVSCHVVAPGPVWTERLKTLLAETAKSRNVTEESVIAEFKENSPLGHLVTIDEVAWAVELHLAPEARAIAGTTLFADAGQRTSIP
jgi:NAD(P)-dependent dehydrogenase (short-subunit alcohol dehydrogenase family)